MLPTRRGTGVLVAAAVTFVLAPIMSLPALLEVTSLLLGLVVLAALFALVGHARVDVARTVEPEVLAPGGHGTVTVHVTNRASVPTLAASWSDHVPRALTATARGLLPALSRRGTPGSTARVTYDLQGARRGRHRIGPLRVAVGDPFGLVVRERVHGEVDEVLVLPRRVQLWPLAPRGADDDGAHQPAPQHAGVGDDDVIARAYLPGDALKRVHWKATARRGELMVRQEEQQINPRAAVLLETSQEAYDAERGSDGSWDHNPLFEWAVSAAASVTAHLTRIGYAVTTGQAGNPEQRRLGDGHDLLTDALVDLAVVDPDPVAGLDAADPGERTVFVVLGRLDVARARAWAETLAHAETVLAFVAAGSRTEALDVLSAARWRCVEYRSSDDLAERWNELDGSRSVVAS
ncbi:MAG: DUF58 domain-containing protein [Aeromicrobium erythreum]